MLRRAELAEVLRVLQRRGSPQHAETGTVTSPSAVRRQVNQLAHMELRPRPRVGGTRDTSRTTSEGRSPAVEPSVSGFVDRCTSATMADPGSGEDLPRVSPVQGGGLRSFSPPPLRRG